MEFRIWLESQGVRIFPIGNIFMPPQTIYPEKIEAYKNNPSLKLPKGVIDGGSKFPGWESLDDFPNDPKYPNVYVTDGVHRILAQIQLGQQTIRIEIEDGKFY